MKKCLWGIPRSKSTTNHTKDSILGLILLMFIFLLMTAQTAYAVDITLAWDANEPQPDGYNLYIRAEGEAYDYDLPAWTGMETTATLNDLTEGTTYYFVVRAYLGNEESSNSNEILFTTSNNGQDNESKMIVIDDSDPSIAATQRWNVSSGKTPYGGQSLYSIKKNATYTYTSEISGSFDVALWWSFFGNRCDNVPVEIYDGDTLLNTVYVNQHEETNSGKWYNLGNYDFSGQASVKVIAQDNTCSTCADAVSFSGE